MRQLLIQVPRGQGHRVMDAARTQRGTNLFSFAAHDEGHEIDVALVHVDNDKVEPLLDELQQLPHLRVVLVPQGVIALHPPQDDAPEQVTNVAHRSPIEIFLGGLQSVGSWGGFLGYAVAAGVVVWIGMFTNTPYLLVAAMLIAPFAGPAMNTALATARGDRTLLRRGVVRYFASLAITVVVALLLSLILRQEIATQMMIEQSMISSVTVLLPLVAGAAGALNLCQSDRNSLVSGAATGMLVAASLAPPAGLIGMAAAIGEWAMVRSGAFVLLLQLVGINAAGAVVFRLFGLSPRGARYNRGKRWISWVAWVVSLAVIAGLLTWQLSNQPELQRSSRSQRAAAEVRKAVDQSGIANLIEANVRFTRADVSGGNSLLVITYVQPTSGANRPDDEIRRRIRQLVRHRLRNFNVTPLVEVNVVRD